jgi:hypothetical protein
VDFEVLDDVSVGNYVVIPKGSLAIGTVTEAEPKHRMGRAGKLEIVLDYVRLADKNKAAIRAVKDAKGSSHTAGMTAGIVATGLLFWPAAPFFLFMHGKDITVPKGAEVTAYITGDVHLDPALFSAKTADGAAMPEADGSVMVNTKPNGAEVYADGSFLVDGVNAIFRHLTQSVRGSSSEDLRNQHSFRRDLWPTRTCRDPLISAGLPRGKAH